MDPFARKMILGALAFGSAMLLIAGALSLVYFHLRPRCSEQVLSQAISPDKLWIAAVMERRCGDESPLFVHVNLRPAQQPIRLGYFSGLASQGEVLLEEQDSPETTATVQWSSSDQLDIRCARCGSTHAKTRRERWRSIRIRHQDAP